MTKKLVCLLLAAFLFVSLVALVVACSGKSQPLPADAGVSAVLPADKEAGT